MNSLLVIGQLFLLVCQKNLKKWFLHLTFLQCIVMLRYNHIHVLHIKENKGHALIVAGSTGKTGAAVLAARACISSGCVDW
jgi:hypothetical protein